ADVALVQASPRLPPRCLPRCECDAPVARLSKVQSCADGRPQSPANPSMSSAKPPEIRFHSQNPSPPATLSRIYSPRAAANAPRTSGRRSSFLADRATPKTNSTAQAAKSLRNSPTPTAPCLATNNQD